MNRLKELEEENKQLKKIISLIGNLINDENSPSKKELCTIYEQLCYLNPPHQGTSARKP